MDEKLDAKNGNEEVKDTGRIKTVVIQQGNKGYGLIVSGESPVNVQSVREGGPADLAGVRKGDSLLMVNDTPVSKYAHTDVVNIIKSTQCVKLSLRSFKETSEPAPESNLRHFQRCSEREITAPLPVNPTLQNKLEFNKTKTLHIYLEKQRKVRDSIKIELQKVPLTKSMQRNLEKQLDTTDRQIHNIMEEIKKSMKDGELQQFSTRSSARSPPLLRNAGSHPPTTHPLQQPTYQQHSRSSSDMPPPLPARNRNLCPQMSAPNMSSIFHPNLGLMGAAPPLPPRPPHLERDNAHSLENIPKVSNLVHSNSSGSDSSVRIHTHQRVKSSPDPLHGIQSNPAGNRLSYSDSFGDLSTKVISSVITEDEPPGTPPPPYGNSSSLPPPYCSSSTLGLMDENSDENYTSVLDEHSPDVPDGSSNPALTLPVEGPFAPPPYSNRSLLPYFQSLNNNKYVQAVTSPTSGQACSPSNSKETWASSILTMEDEDGDCLLEDHGPFQSLTKLISMKYNAYMAVFLNYVISNCDPSSLFFYIITELYKDGGVKEMKKWAYEIHSSFLIPGAPMKLHNVEESILYEIDEMLQTSLDKEEILRIIFLKARQRSREDINEQLADFRSKRTAGLGSLFGPQDHILEETVTNKVRELSVVEQLLVPVLECVSDDIKNQMSHSLIKASSLATILWKYFNVKSQQAQQLIDRCPLFVNKDRPLKSKILRGNKKQCVRDHHFSLMTFYSLTHCNHCSNIIYGIAPQGYQCSDCEMNIHKSCVKNVEETCVGQVQVHRKLGLFLQKIMPEERDRVRKSSHVIASQIERARRGFEDCDFFGQLLETEAMLGDKVNTSSAKEQRRSDPGGGGQIPNHLHHPSNGGSLEEDGHNSALDDTDQGSQDAQISSSDYPPNNFSKSQHLHKKKSGTSINRSESCKEKQHARKQARENRKNSDPNIPTSKSGDVDGDNPLNFHSGSSSNSSLSQSQESPPGNSSEQVEAYASALDNDSDIEAEADLPDWTARLSPEAVERLSSKDRKRQDTINEFFHTEQSHVRILKVLHNLFHQPLRQAGLVSPELLDRLFPNLDQMLKFHTSFNKLMKKRRQDSALVNAIGDILSTMFEGEDGSQFQQAAAEFVACQGYALESLKQQQKRDQKLATFLQDRENHPHCRRLQLKDMLPAGFQRLSKYPLLLESLLSYTDKSKQTEEYEQISRASERCKEILAYVNAAVHEADNQRRLREIQKRLDQSSLTKNKHGNCEELRGDMDLTKHKLVHEGPLTWKTSRGQKSIDLHVLILEDCVVLLQKDSDKFILKYHSMNKSLGKDDSKLNLSPIIKFGTFLCREVATDKCGIFIILTQSTLSAQIYELVATSSAERSVWLRHLHDAQANYKEREGRNRRQHPSPHLPDAEDTSTSTDLRDVVDDGVEGDTSESLEADCLSSKAKPEDSLSLVVNVTPSSPEPPTKKTDCAAATPKGILSASTPPTRSRRLQEVQIIQIVEGPSLIQPSEVKVSQGVVLSAEPVLTPIELLRRKDLLIRQELEEKQNLIADILNIPREHFESVADMAGEVGLSNKEPRELVLGAIFQAKRLQEALNEAQTIRDSDVIAAQAVCPSDSGKASVLPLYQGPMEKLLCISGTLTQLLNSLMGLVSDRDEERERMRKELIASRERIHQLHMQQNDASCPGGPSGDPTTSPQSSRPSSFVSVTSSAAEHSDHADQPHTDEEIKLEARIPLEDEIQSTVESSSEREETSGGDSPNQMQSCSKDLTDSSVTLTEESGLST